MRTLGIDPGSANLGWSVVDTSGVRPAVIAAGHISTPPEWAWADRLAALGRQIVAVIAEHQVDNLAIEDVTAAVYGAQLKRGATTTDRRLQATADGWILMAGALDLPYCFVLPSQWRAAAGCGARATKEQVRECLVRLVGLAPKAALHTSDATAIAIAGGRRMRAEVASGKWVGGTRVVRLPTERAAKARLAVSMKRKSVVVDDTSAAPKSSRKRSAA